MAERPPPKIELDPASDEPQLLADLRRYWERKRGLRAMPARQDILPSEIKPLLPHVVLVDVVGAAADFRYRLVGSRLQGYFPASPTGMLMSDILATFGPATVEATLDIYRSVLMRRAPLRIKGDGAWFAQNPKYFDAILTPLSDADGTASMIFGAFVFEWNFKPAEEAESVDGERAWAAAIALH